jgi:hypothetical protein
MVERITREDDYGGRVARRALSYRSFGIQYFSMYSASAGFIAFFNSVRLALSSSSVADHKYFQTRSVSSFRSSFLYRCFANLALMF